jgi:hypothetical protein
LCDKANLLKSLNMSTFIEKRFYITGTLRSIRMMEQKGMTFDHDFCYLILLFSSLLKKEG